MTLLQSIASAMGGEVSGNRAKFPTPGHSKQDRGSWASLVPGAPDGVLIYSANGGDALAIKDELRAKGILPQREGYVHHHDKPAAGGGFWTQSDGTDARQKAPEANDNGPWKAVASFEYANADGEIVYRTVRREPENWTGQGKRPKKFVAERFEDGRWVSGMGDRERLPYRLCELRQAIGAGETVFLVEGEAKADKLANWGFAATAIAFGANGWRADYAQHFAGATIIILPDNDAKGRDFASNAYADLKSCASPFLVELPGLPDAGDIMDWQGSAAELESLCSDPAEPDWFNGDNAGPKKPASAFQFVAVGDLQYRPPEFLVQDLIETETLGLAFGDPGCGKSFLAVDVGMCVASGTPFHGRPVKQGSVFFIAGEGHNGLARRFAAWSVARGVSLAGVPLFKSERAAQMLNAASAASVADGVRKLAGEHGAPALIIIDTLARNFGAGDENNTKDMSEFVAAIDNLKGQFPGCAVLIIHHSGHAEKGRARGAMALKGALDFEYRIAKNEETVRMSCTKMKDAPEPSDVSFAFRNVELDERTQSAVLEAGKAQDRKTTFTGTQRLALNAFVDAAAEHGTFEGDDTTGLHLDDWQPAFLSRHTGDNEESKKRAFRRARTDLVEAGTLTVLDDFYSTQSAEILAAINAKRTGRT